jgi:hypothetical protein
MGNQEANTKTCVAWSPMFRLVLESACDDYPYRLPSSCGFY